MQTYWTNFAKTGNPNRSDETAADMEFTQWPAFTSATRAYVDFTSAGPVAKQDLQRQACDVYINLLKTKLTQ